MNISTYRHFGLALLLGSSAACFAQPAGYVKNVTGDATVTSGGRVVKAQPGTPLSVGDTITTEPASSMGLTLRDNTLMSFGPSTRFTLDDYLFAPARGDLKLGGKIASGTMHYVSGAIAHLKPEAVEIKTPTGIIGVRGTRFCRPRATSLSTVGIRALARPALAQASFASPPPMQWPPPWRAC
jgi:hypothetical protein